MGFYRKYIIPRMTDWACRQNPSMRQREKVIPLATGQVIEIGIGTGLNLRYYDPARVRHLTGIDPSADNWKINKVREEDLPFGFEFVQAGAGSIPADNNTFDTAVITYTLCSIQEVPEALEEIKRVLKPGGQLIFCEHGLAPDPKLQWWQHKLNPAWRTLSGGCNMDRDIPSLIRKNGFKIKVMDTMFLPGWKILNYNFWGTAASS